MEDLCIILFGIAVLAILGIYLLLRKRIRNLEDEITRMKYVFVQKEPDGSYTFTDRQGNKIFEL